MKVMFRGSGRRALAAALTVATAGAVAPGEAASPKPADSMVTVHQQEWGKTPDGTVVHLFTLTNRQGVVAKVTSFGAILTELRVPDRAGRPANVVLGFDNLDQYVKGHPAFGATIGRFANRIAKARFSIDGVEYKVAANSGANHIHGGRQGFDKRVWQARPLLPKDREAAVDWRN